MDRIHGTIALALVLAACSSGGSTSNGGPVVNSTPQPQELITFGNRYDLTAVEDRDVMTSSILAPLDSVWRVVPAVFLELGVEPGTIDQQHHVISNTAFNVRHTIGDVRLSRYFECGSSITGSAADQLVLTVSLTVQVVPDSSDLSTLRTQLNAHAKSEGTAGVLVHCGSTGALEQRIARMVNDALAHRAKK